MSDALLSSLRDLIQIDPGGRGLATVPGDNLLTACPDDFANACCGLAQMPHANLLIVTGFYIADAQPACGETDGPLGALFLARALPSLGVDVTLATDSYCMAALRAGLEACRLQDAVSLVELPSAAQDSKDYVGIVHGGLRRSSAPLTHLLAIERVGPEQHGRCYTMSGRDVTPFTSPAHVLFEEAPCVTIGIGDGGNEIGMGKIAWDVIRRNIRGGDKIACRVPVDHLIVAGVSNWGAYALAAGVRLLRGAAFDAELFSVERERQLLQRMVDAGPLVDGVTKRQTATVDGLTWEQYAEPLRQIAALIS